MKYAIVSDLHANLDALDRVLADAVQCGADQIVCLGDVVGYGPLPAETLKRIRASASLVLAGNHDDAVSGRIDAKDFIDLAGDAVSRHREALSRDDLAWLKSLPHTAEIEGAVLAHGDLTAPAEFNYIDSEDAAAANFAATDASLVFVGHTHVPGIYLTGQSGRVYALGAEDFVREDGKRYIVNVGSVGYPRESGGRCYSSYALYDTADGSVRFRSLPFAVASVLQRGRTFGKRRLLAVLVGVALLAAAALAAVLSSSRQQLPHNNLPPPVMARTLVFDGHEKTVSAQLTLTKKSPKGLLTITYFDTQGKELAPVAQTVKESNRKFAIPEGAVRADIALRSISTNNLPIVRTFTPVAE